MRIFLISIFYISTQLIGAQSGGYTINSIRKDKDLAAIVQNRQLMQVAIRFAEKIIAAEAAGLAEPGRQELKILAKTMNFTGTNISYISGEDLYPDRAYLTWTSEEEYLNIINKPAWTQFGSGVLIEELKNKNQTTWVLIFTDSLVREFKIVNLPESASLQIELKTMLAPAEMVFSFGTKFLIRPELLKEATVKSEASEEAGNYSSYRFSIPQIELPLLFTSRRVATNETRSTDKDFLIINSANSGMSQ